MSLLRKIIWGACLWQADGIKMLLQNSSSCCGGEDNTTAQSNTDKKQPEVPRKAPEKKEQEKKEQEKKETEKPKAATDEDLKTKQESARLLLKNLQEDLALENFEKKSITRMQGKLNVADKSNILEVETQVKDLDRYVRERAAASTKEKDIKTAMDRAKTSDNESGAKALRKLDEDIRNKLTNFMDESLKTMKGQDRKDENGMVKQIEEAVRRSFADQETQLKRRQESTDHLKALKEETQRLYRGRFESQRMRWKKEEFNRLDNEADREAKQKFRGICKNIAVSLGVFPNSYDEEEIFKGTKLRDAVQRSRLMNASETCENKQILINRAKEIKEEKKWNNYIKNFYNARKNRPIQRVKINSEIIETPHMAIHYLDPDEVKDIVQSAYDYRRFEYLAGCLSLLNRSAWQCTARGKKPAEVERKVDGMRKDIWGVIKRLGHFDNEYLKGLNLHVDNSDRVMQNGDLFSGENSDQNKLDQEKLHARQRAVAHGYDKFKQGMYKHLEEFSAPQQQRQFSELKNHRAGLLTARENLLKDSGKIKDTHDPRNFREVETDATDTSDEEARAMRD